MDPKENAPSQPNTSRPRVGRPRTGADVARGAPVKTAALLETYRVRDEVFSPGNLLGVKEAAALLDLSKSTLDKMRVYGGGPRYAKLGRSVKYAKADLAAWIAEGTRASTSCGALLTTHAQR